MRHCQDLSQMIHCSGFVSVLWNFLDCTNCSASFGFKMHCAKPTTPYFPDSPPLFDFEPIPYSP